MFNIYCYRPDKNVKKNPIEVTFPLLQTNWISGEVQLQFTSSFSIDSRLHGVHTNFHQKALCHTDSLDKKRFMVNLLANAATAL